ncbi:hypothetical protein EDD15DRAFT_2376648 [Pisolithus albus]|nr:hypothetical protein EDD15DRAFT_2376648 [Pisolithus albus]
MPPKRKPTSKVAANSQFTAAEDADDVVESPHAKRQRADQRFEDPAPPMPDPDPNASQPRRSARPRKGCGGQLQQLRNLERVQTTEYTRPSTRNLDAATQGQAVNPMAPGHSDDDEESQIPPWASQPMSDLLVRPSFTASQPGQTFGFRIPSQLTVSSTNSARSITSHGSCLSSVSSSVFSRSISHGSSSVPTSLTHSECGSNGAYGTQGDTEDSQTAPQRRLSQRPTLAADHNSDAPHNSRVRSPFSQPSSGTLAQDQRAAHNNDTPSPPQPVGLRRTRSFAQLPSTISNAHTMLAGNDEDEVRAAEDDLIVDDVSPSEDDRFAESIVRGRVRGDTRHDSQLSEERSQSTGSRPKDSHLSGPPTTQREVEDVIAQHRQRNRGPRLPDTSQLTAVHIRQTSEGPHRVSRSDVDGQPPPTTDVVPSHPLPAATSTASGRMPDANSDPSHLQFYPPSVRDILERAKQISHCDLAAINSFPLRADFSRKASEYVVEAIAERRSKGLLIPDGWWPHYATGITKLLWEDLGNWHSALKKKARFFVQDRYEWDPQNCRDVNAGIARKLLERGDFLKDSVDEEGHTNNLAHPALSSLIIEFFYTGSNAMANIFPEVFQLESQTQIKVALDEVVAEGKEVAFKCDVYADVYADILGLMAKCDTAAVHRSKTKACRVQWAKIGRCVYYFSRFFAGLKIIVFLI